MKSYSLLSLLTFFSLKADIIHCEWEELVSEVEELVILVVSVVQLKVF